MVFCFQNCSDLLWVNNVLVMKKNFEAEEFANFLRSVEQSILAAKGQNNFCNVILICATLTKRVFFLKGFCLRIFLKKYCIQCKYLVRTLQHFQNLLELFLPLKTWKKYPQKLLKISPDPFLCNLATQTTQKQKSCTTKSP